MTSDRVQKWKRHLAGGTALCTGALLAALATDTAHANPEGGRVVAGSAQIKAVGPNKLDVVQSTRRAVIEWDRFSIERGEHTHFDQPSSRAVTLNRVTGRDLSRIAGRLTADGTIVLVNPAGVIFGKTASIDVGGLVATTSDIADQDFMQGRMTFRPSLDSHGEVINEGRITVAEGGVAALVAPWVRNDGVISARLGRVELASADTFTVDLYGDGLIQLALGDDSVAARAVNAGVLSAEGGVVAMSAASASSAVDGVVNTGRIEARSVGRRGGKIVLLGGDAGLEVGGELDAIGDDAGETGGEIILASHTVGIDGAVVDASGEAGGGEIRAGGGPRGEAPMAGVSTADAIAVDAESTLRADARAMGDGGTVTIWGTDSASHEGVASARGGAKSGDGGVIELSSRGAVGLTGWVRTDASDGEDGVFILDPRAIIIAERGTNPPDPFADDNIIRRDDPGAAPDDAQIISVGNFRRVVGSIRLEATDFIQLDVPVNFRGQGPGDSVVFDAGGEIRLNAPVTAAGADVTFTGDRIIVGGGAPVTVQSSGATITFDGDVEAAVAGSSALDVVMDDGLTQFTGSIGANSRLGRLTINGDFRPELFQPFASNVRVAANDPVQLDLRLDRDPGSGADGGQAGVFLDFLDRLPAGSRITDGETSLPIGDDGSVDLAGFLGEDRTLPPLVLLLPARSDDIFRARLRTETPGGGIGELSLAQPGNVGADIFGDGTSRDPASDEAPFTILAGTGEGGPGEIDICKAFPDVCGKPTKPAVIPPTNGGGGGGGGGSTEGGGGSGPGGGGGNGGGGDGGDDLSIIEPGAGTAEAVPEFFDACPDIVNDTVSYHTTAYEAAFRSDPRTTPYSVNIFCGGYQIAAPLRGASIDYTGLTFVTRDFWTDLKQASTPELIDEIKGIFLGDQAGR